MTLPQEPCSTQIRVLASPRRRRTVSARLVDGVIELRVPSWMSESDRASWAERMRNRIEHQLGRAQPSDRILEGRAQALNQRHFDGRLSWSSIAFAEQQHRWGSCSWTAGVIRISSRAALLPAFVRDYLLIHEMAHLEVPDHSESFWQLVYSYPQTERARGYLMALDHQASRVKGRPPTE